MTRNELSALGLACLTVVAALAIVVGQSGSKWHPFEPVDSSDSQTSPTASTPSIPMRPTLIESPPLTSCLPEGVADKAKIVILGAYEGGTQTALGIEGEQHDVGTIAVAANPDGPPILVIVTAYDPVIWDFRNVPTKRIRAVVAYGYANQAIAGVSRDVPVRFISYTTPNPLCGQPAYAYEGGRNLDQLAANIVGISGRQPDGFQGAYDPSGFHLDGGSAPSAQPEALAATGIRAAVAVRRDTVPPKETGIAELINAGKLRPANASDIAQLSNALSKASPTGNLAPVRVSLPTGAFVVLAQTAIPKGMYGAHSATFLVPPGIPMPVDPGSHNSYFMLADGSCVGPMCNLDGQ